MAHPTPGVHPLPPLYLGNPFARAQFEHLVDSLDRGGGGGGGGGGVSQEELEELRQKIQALDTRAKDAEEQNEREHMALSKTILELFEATKDEEKPARARKLLAGALKSKAIPGLDPKYFLKSFEDILGELKQKNLLEARSELNDVIESGGSNAAIQNLQDQVKKIEQWNTDITEFLTEQVTEPIRELQNDMTDEEEGYVPRSLQDLEAKLRELIKKNEDDRQSSDLAKQGEAEAKALQDDQILDKKIQQQIEAVEAREAAARQEEFQALSAQVQEDANKLEKYEARLEKLSQVLQSLSDEIQALPSSKKPKQVQRDSVQAMFDRAAAQEREEDLREAAAAAAAQKREEDLREAAAAAAAKENSATPNPAIKQASNDGQGKRI